MNDDQILERGGTEEDIAQYAETNGATNPLPQRIQRKRIKGWKMPPNAISVTRPGMWGNPYIIGKDDSARGCVLHFTYDLYIAAIHLKNEKVKQKIEYIAEFSQMYGLPKYVETNPKPKPYALKIIENISLLKDKDLACWCNLKDYCHANIYIQIANE